MRNETLARTALVAFGLLVSLGLAEGTLRYFDPFRERLRGDRLSLPHDIRFAIDNRSNPRLEPAVEHSKNSLGFRGPEPPRDRTRLLTAFAVGGSTTECFYLQDGKDWPSLVGKRLSCAFPSFWIDNAGLDGHSTYGHRKLLEQRILRLRPDVVLLLVGANEVGREDLLGAGEGLTRPPTRAEALARHSMLVSTGLNAWRTLQAHRRGVMHQALDLAQLPVVATDAGKLEETLRAHEQRLLPAFRARLAGLVSLCRENGVLPVLLTQPALFGEGRDDATGVDLETFAAGFPERAFVPGNVWNGRMAWTLLERYNDQTRALAAEQGVPLIDLARRLAKTSRYFYDEMHFTNEGSSAVAAIVGEELCPLLGARFPARRTGDCGRSCP